MLELINSVIYWNYDQDTESGVRSLHFLWVGHAKRIKRRHFDSPDLVYWAQTYV